jgi:hypothetical protein
VNKILHAPLSELRRRGADRTLYIDAVRVLFRLGVGRDREPDDEDSSRGPTTFGSALAARTRGRRPRWSRATSGASSGHAVELVLIRDRRRAQRGPLAPAGGRASS